MSDVEYGECEEHELREMLSAAVAERDRFAHENTELRSQVGHLKTNLSGVTKAREELQGIATTAQQQFDELNVMTQQLQADITEALNQRDQLLQVLGGKSGEPLVAKALDIREQNERVSKESVCAFCNAVSPRTETAMLEHMKVCEKHPYGQEAAAKSAASIAWVVLSNHIDVVTKVQWANCVATLADYFQRPA